MVTINDIGSVWRILDGIMDPEVPVLSITNLGIVRDVKVHDDQVIVTITPTYSGCPAMDVISVSIRMELLANGFDNIRIEQVLSPAWTTNWITDEGKQRLKEYGIAPPQLQSRINALLFSEETNIECPRCGSHNTRTISEFGSTACKSLFQCNDCLEPFDYFKCH